MDKKTEELKTCRICLNSFERKYDSLSIFKDYKGSTIFVYINSIADIAIKEDDGFPQFICKLCFQELETALSFKDKCRRSNELLLLNIEKELNCDNRDLLLIVKKEESFDDEHINVTQYEVEYAPDENNGNYSEVNTYAYDLKDEDIKVETCIKKETKEKVLVKKEKVIKSKSIDLKLECHDCGGFFKSKCKLKVHWHKVHLPNSLMCVICQRTFRSYKALNNHKKKPPKSCLTGLSVRIEGIGKSRTFFCKECDYHSKWIKNLRAHLVVHTGERKYSCGKCGLFFTQVSSLSSHKERVHSEIKFIMTCQYCGKIIEGRDKAYRHLRTHRNKQVKCPVCNKMLRSRSLKEHLKRHSGVKTLSCTICAKAFYSLSEFSNHNKTHSAIAIYNCDLCSYKAKYKKLHKLHRQKHEYMPFLCEICFRFYSDEDLFKKHQRNHNNRMYKCTYCDARFTDRKNRWAHENYVHKKRQKGKLVKKDEEIKKE